MTSRHKLILESPSLQEEKLPKKKSALSSESYVMQIANLPDHYAASASSPANTIDIFDKKTLKGFETLSGHQNGTSCIKATPCFAGNSKPHLISSGYDGCVKVWDYRTNKATLTMCHTKGSHQLLSCDVSPDGLTVAAGTDLKGVDAYILYWDPRQPGAPLRTHGSTHSDDITTLKFSPNRDPEGGFNVLLSGSTDGLVCTSNADENDEDEAGIQVGNWGCSVSQVGWIDAEGVGRRKHDNQARIWASSDMETFSTWTHELDQLLSLDIRIPSREQHRSWTTDYLITCHSSSASVPNLSVFAGSNDGHAALLSNLNFSVPDAPWTLHKLWKGGHEGIVRSLLWDEQNNVLVTGGEDGYLCTWPCNPVDQDDDIEVDDGEEEEKSTDDSDEMDVDPTLTSPKSRKRDRNENGHREHKKARRD